MMKKNNDSVPRLDLAPQLKRPLSIWNPLDYLRLLYWVFFFPQALRWYTEKYGGWRGLAKQTTWQSKLEFLREHPNQLKLWFQGLILTVCAPYLFCKLLEQIGFTIYWLFVVHGVMQGMLVCMSAGVAFGVRQGVVQGVAVRMATGMAGGVAVGVTLGVVGGVEVSVAGGVPVGVVLSMALGVAGGVALGVWGGVLLGMALGVAGGVAGGIALGMGFGVGVGVGFGVLRGLLEGVERGLLGGVGFGVAVGVASSMTLGVGILHPENWLIGVPLNWNSIQNRSFLLPRITPIPLPLLTTRLKYWLRKDWQLALENIDQLLRYSLQFIPVVNAINQVLAEIPPEQMIYRISQLAENPYDWKLVKFASASLTEELKLKFLRGLKYFLGTNSLAPTRLDTPSRAIAAGFWHFHEKEPEKATVAFEKVRSLLYGEEMFLLAQTLTQFQTATSPNAIAKIQIPNFPPEPHLRSTTWEAIKGLCRVVEDTQLILKATSKSPHAFALARAIGQLREILDNADTLPQAERGLIVRIAQIWQKALESIATNVEDVYY